jgi:hypothetical protein
MSKRLFMQAGTRGIFLVHILLMEQEKCIEFYRLNSLCRWRIVDIPLGSINMGTIQFMIWTKMPARSCGRRNCSPRYWLVEDSLAPGNSRTGNHQLPPQIRHQNDLEMLNLGNSSSDSGKPEACTRRWDTPRVHASGFNPGSVT